MNDPFKNDFDKEFRSMRWTATAGVFVALLFWAGVIGVAAYLLIHNFG